MLTTVRPFDDTIGVGGSVGEALPIVPLEAPYGRGFRSNLSICKYHEFNLRV